MHFFFFAVPGEFGCAGDAVGTVGAQAVSVGATEFFRGLGVVTAKSAALLLVSSLASSAVGHPAGIERRSAMPEVSAGAGVPERRSVRSSS